MGVAAGTVPMGVMVEAALGQVVQERFCGGMEKGE
jgi:hypothetical protein